MRRILSFVTILSLCCGLALSRTAQAQDVVTVPTWNVGDTWTYSENGSYVLENPVASVTLNETLTYTVTGVSATEYTVTKTSTNVSGTIRYSGLTFQLCTNPRSTDTGTLRVRRSDLRVISERRLITANVVPIIGCVSNAVRADITLNNLGIGPSAYDFPLYDGNSFMFTPGIQATGVIAVNIPGIISATVPIDATPDTTVATTVSFDAASGQYDIKSTLNTAGEGVAAPSITDRYNPAAKTYRQQVLSANIPGIATASYTRNMTGSNLATPSSTITLLITGPFGDATAQRGDTVNLAGAVTPAPPEGTTVTLRQPEFSANWTATTDADGNYTVDVTVPANFMDTIMRDSGILANAGIIATAGNAYTVSTLTVLP